MQWFRFALHIDDTKHFAAHEGDGAGPSSAADAPGAEDDVIMWTDEGRNY